MVENSRDQPGDSPYSAVRGIQLGEPPAANSTALVIPAGKSVAGLESAIEAEVKAELDKEVASGTITSAQEKDMLSGLSAHLDDIVNGTRPAGPGPGVLIGPGA